MTYVGLELKSINFTILTTNFTIVVKNMIFFVIMCQNKLLELWNYSIDVWMNRG